MQTPADRRGPRRVVATFAEIRVGGRRRVDRRPPPPGMLMCEYCYSSVVATHPSATAVPSPEGSLSASSLRSSEVCFSEISSWSSGPSTAYISHSRSERQAIKLVH
jgi:hypothetical protein